MTDSRLYRTIWRWHFYAGLIVAPFLLILSVTGAIYLFGDELNEALMPELQFVTPVVQPLPPSQLIAAALATHPGSATRIDLPDAADRPAKVYVHRASGDPLQVMIDPGSARVLGSFVYTHTLVGFADVMHGSLTLGPRGDAVVEVAACWALMLIVTGVCLWWPRGRVSFAGVLWPRLRARGRMFWRDIHAVTGVWTVALIAFLLLTGLPWAVVQGPLVRGAVSVLGIGDTSDRWGYTPPQSLPAEEALGRVPWGMAAHPIPTSDPAHADHRAEHRTLAQVDPAGIAGADAIAAQAAARGVSGGYRLYLPSGPTGIYTVLRSTAHPEDQRTLHFDRWTGRLIEENGWARYGVGTRAIELGVQIHMGRYFGLPNQLLMLVPCIAIVVLIVSGVTMWWRRRPRGRLAAPPAVGGARVGWLVGALAVGGLMLPLFGASLVVLAVIDRIVVAVRGQQPAGI